MDRSNCIYRIAMGFPICTGLVLALLLNACGGSRELQREVINAKPWSSIEPKVLLSCIPTDSLSGFASHSSADQLPEFTSFYTSEHLFIGDSVETAKYHRGTVPDKGMLYIKMIGLRSDTLYHIALFFSDGTLSTLWMQAASTFYYDVNGMLRPQWIVGQIYAKSFDPECIEIVTAQYVPYLADTSIESLTYSDAEVESADTGVACYVW